MGQITEQFAADMLDRAERGLHPQFTVWEAKQLLMAWQERETLRKDAERYRYLRDKAPTGKAVQLVQWMPGEMDARVDEAMAGR